MAQPESDDLHETLKTVEAFMRLRARLMTIIQNNIRLNDPQTGVEGVADAAECIMAMLAEELGQ